MNFKGAWNVKKDGVISMPTQTTLVSLWYMKYTWSSADYYGNQLYRSQMIAHQGNQRYFIHTFRVSWLCDYCMICKIDKKLSRNRINISCHKIGKWIDNHPKRPWWILNTCVADYCMVNGEGKMHNTTILGKYLSRKKTFWQHEPGVSVLNGMWTVHWVIFDWVLNDYWFCIICLSAWLILFVIESLFDWFYLNQIIWLICWFIFKQLFDCSVHADNALTCSIVTTGFGVCDWGSRINFFRFPDRDQPQHSEGNSAANTQLLLQYCGCDFVYDCVCGCCCCCDCLCLCLCILSVSAPVLYLSMHFVMFVCVSVHFFCVRNVSVHFVCICVCVRAFCPCL